MQAPQLLLQGKHFLLNELLLVRCQAIHVMGLKLFQRVLVLAQ